MSTILRTCLVTALLMTAAEAEAKQPGEPLPPEELVHFFRYHTSLATQRLLGLIENLSQPLVAAFIATSQEWKDSNAAVERYTGLYFGCAYASIGCFVIDVGVILYGAALMPHTRLPGVEY